MIRDSQVRTKFFYAFEDVRQKIQGIDGSSKKSYMDSVFSTMSLAKKTFLQSDVSVDSINSTFRRFNISLALSDQNQELTPRNFGALYEYYSKRTDLAAFYSSSDVATYISRQAIGNWLFDRIYGDQKPLPGLFHGSDVIGEIKAAAGSSDKVCKRLQKLLSAITILDPTCGCGAFYFAALELLFDLNLLANGLSTTATNSEKRRIFERIVEKNLFGVDIDSDAIKVVRLQLSLYHGGFGGSIPQSPIKDNLKYGDALVGSPHFEGQTQYKTFNWTKEFSQILDTGGFSVIVGNPPYLEFEEASSGEYAKINASTSNCRDLYALTIERSFHVLSENGTVGFIVPISAYSSPRFKSLRHLLHQKLSEISISSYANRPAQLFKGAQKRLNIILGKHGPSEPIYFTSEYLRWRNEERKDLFSKRVKFVKNSLVDSEQDIFPKCGNSVDIRIHKTIQKFKSDIPWANHLKPTLDTNPSGKLFFTRAFGYFLYFLTFKVTYRNLKTGTKILPSEYHALEIINKKHEYAAAAILNSSLFYWYMSQMTDCRNVNYSEVLSFPIAFERFDHVALSKLSKVGKQLMSRLKDSSYETQKSGIQIQSFDYIACKKDIDACDSAVCQAYGLSTSEADRIKSYDATYRFSVKGKRTEEEAA